MGIDRRRFLAQSGLLTSATLMPWPLPAAPAAAAPALRIGMLGPFSGPASGTGRDIRQGIQMALDDALAEGELPVRLDGVLRDLDAVWIDSQSDPAVAAAAVSRVLERDAVDLMFGGWHTAVALAVMDVEAAYGILHLGNVGSAQTIADRINSDPVRYRGWFKGWPSPAKLIPQYRDPLTHFLQQGLWRPATLKAAVAIENTPWGESWGEAMVSTLRQIGFDTPAPDTIRIDQVDFHSLLKRYRQQKVSLVAMTNVGNEAAASFVRQFREVGVEALLVADSLRGTSDWYQRSGEASNYAISMDAAMPIALWQRWWVRRYQAKFGHFPNIGAAGLHYDYMRMTVRVLNSAGSLDRDRLINAVYRTPYRGIWNYYRFARRPGANAISANEVMAGRFMEGFFFPMVQLFNGESKIIWPLRYADQRFQAPPWITDAEQGNAGY